MPRRIYILWLQGEAAAPPLVQMCLLRWRRLNPTYEVQVLDSRDAKEILATSTIDLRNLQPQALSDLLRLKLLSERGGLWVDATTFPTVPLDDWLPAVTESGFFALRGHLPPLDVDSWCLASEPGHVMSTLWWQEAERYWSRPRELITFGSETPWAANYNLDPLSVQRTDLAHTADTYPYYWVMYLFTCLLSTNPEFSAAWRLVPERSSADCHAIQLMTADRPEVTDEELVTVGSSTTVQKLSFKDPNGRRWLRLDQAFQERDGGFAVDQAHGVYVHDGGPEALSTRIRAKVTKRARESGGQVLRWVRRTR